MADEPALLRAPAPRHDDFVFRPEDAANVSSLRAQIAMLKQRLDELEPRDVSPPQPASPGQSPPTQIAPTSPSGRGFSFPARQTQ